jgi:hypothetical protein
VSLWVAFAISQLAITRTTSKGEDKIVINMNCSLVAIVFVVAIEIVSAMAAVVYVVSKKCKDKKR